MRERVLTVTGAFRAWWSVLVVVVAAAAVAGLCIVYTNQQQRQADQRWCELLTSLDQPGRTTTERGREIQRQIHRLRLDLGCEER